MTSPPATACTRTGSHAASQSSAGTASAAPAQQPWVRAAPPGDVRDEGALRERGGGALDRADERAARPWRGGDRVPLRHLRRLAPDVAITGVHDGILSPSWTRTVAVGSIDAMSLSALRHDHIALRVADYAATVRWYTQKLGFQVDLEW